MCIYYVQLLCASSFVKGKIHIANVHLHMSNVPKAATSYQN